MSHAKRAHWTNHFLSRCTPVCTNVFDRPERHGESFRERDWITTHLLLSFNANNRPHYSSYSPFLTLYDSHVMHSPKNESRKFALNGESKEPQRYSYDERMSHSCPITSHHLELERRKRKRERVRKTDAASSLVKLLRPTTFMRLVPSSPLFASLRRSPFSNAIVLRKGEGLRRVAVP